MRSDLDRVIADLYEVIRTQHKVISFLVTTDEAIMSSLVELLDGFEANFEAKHRYAERNPGEIGQSLVALQGKLDEVHAKLKRRIGGGLIN